MNGLVVGELSTPVFEVGEYGRLVVDQAGRRWCMIGPRCGFFRDAADGWVYARRWGVVDFTVITVVTNLATLGALDRWETAHVPADGDPTPAHGVVRPHLGLTLAGDR